MPRNYRYYIPRTFFYAFPRSMIFTHVYIMYTSNYHLLECNITLTWGIVFEPRRFWLKISVRSLSGKVCNDHVMTLFCQFGSSLDPLHSRKDNSNCTGFTTDRNSYTCRRARARHVDIEHMKRFLSSNIIANSIYRVYQ